MIFRPFMHILIISPGPELEEPARAVSVHVCAAWYIVAVLSLRPQILILSVMLSIYLSYTHTRARAYNTCTSSFPLQLNNQHTV